MLLTSPQRTTPATHSDPRQQHLDSFGTCYLSGEQEKLDEGPALEGTAEKVAGGPVKRGRGSQCAGPGPGELADEEERNKYFITIHDHYGSMKRQRKQWRAVDWEHHVPLVVLWVCSDESVLHLTQRKEVG